jgi:hypothetical protein
MPYSGKIQGLIYIFEMNHFLFKSLLDMFFRKIKKITLALAVFILGITVNSCKKEGIGGSATIVAFPQHHTKPIYGATIYVKFGATELPSNPTSNYNLKIVGDPSQNYIRINGLLYGNYYLYSVGYDPLIGLPVTGGIATTISWANRQKELDINVPVSE